MLQIPELLAPAGDLERLRYAINYGADAVYCALPEFGMRSAPTNFTPEQLSEGVIYAHARGRKVYLTMNTLPTNEEADRLPEAIKDAAAAGVDAFHRGRPRRVGRLQDLRAGHRRPYVHPDRHHQLGLRPAPPTTWARSGWCWPVR